VRAYPLTLQGVEFRGHRVVGIYPLQDTIAYIHFAFGAATREEHEQDGRAPSYAILDLFSADFGEHRQSCLAYHEQELFCATDADCREENGTLIVNTKHYTGFGPSIAKLLQVRDAELIEIGDAPPPVARVYNDRKTYVFGDLAVRMATPFVMECRSRASDALVWKLKLAAWLYTEVEERAGLLHFGTAGKGGHFYGVSPADGSVVCRYNTGGTEHYVWHEDKVTLAGRNNKPVLLNPKNGAELRRLEFGSFALPAYQNMLIQDKRFYAAAHDHNGMFAVCVDL